MSKTKLQTSEIFQFTLLFGEILLLCFCFVNDGVMWHLGKKFLGQIFKNIYISIYMKIYKLRHLIFRWHSLSASLRLYFILFARENCSYLQRQVWNSIKLKLLSYCRIQTHTCACTTSLPPSPRPTCILEKQPGPSGKKA